MIDPWASAPARSTPVATSLSLLLSEIEEAALAAYGAHGLPTHPGQYARSHKGKGWRFLANDLTVEERWALVLAQREGSRWRFGALHDLGSGSDNPEAVRQAAAILKSCHLLQSRLDEARSPDLGEAIEAAIGLGSAWRQMTNPAEPPLPESDAVNRASPPKPRTPRKSRAKPKA